MKLLNPSALAWAALAAPILLLYMLKLRRREVVVSSIYLWQRLVQDRQANTPWQRIQKNILLFLQLGILFTLVLGLARPALERPAIATGSIIVLLDGSASMQAKDVLPTRFDAAVGEALRMVDTLRPENSMTVILVNANPEVIAGGESNKSILTAALNAAQVTSAEADWGTAMAVAAGAYRTGEPDITTVILSDGGLGPVSLAPFPGKVQYLQIGKSGENLGISALAARSAGSEAQLLTKISNYGKEDRTVLLSIYRDEELLHATRVAVQAGESQLEFLTGLPDREAQFTAHISNPETGVPSLDGLEIDDWGFAVQRRGISGRVLLVSQGNFFLEQLLAAIPGITAYRALGADLVSRPATEIEDFDLVIFDRTYAELQGASNVLYIDPPANNLFMVSGSFQPGSERVLVSDHPLTRYVNWDQVHIQSASIIDAPEWADILVESGERPLVFAGQNGGQKIAVLTFDVLNSDLALQTSFPILFANLVSYLLPGLQSDLPESLSTGTSPSHLPLETLEAAFIRSPTGETIWQAVDGGPVGLPSFETPGHYTITYMDGGSIQDVSLAVNLFSKLEGKIEPASSLIIGSEAIQPQGHQQVGQYEIWWLFALTAIFLLILEWWVYHRGQIRWPAWQIFTRKP